MHYNIRESCRYTCTQSCTGESAVRVVVLSNAFRGRGEVAAIAFHLPGARYPTISTHTLTAHTILAAYALHTGHQCTSHAASLRILWLRFWALCVAIVHRVRQHHCPFKTLPTPPPSLYTAVWLIMSGELPCEQRRGGQCLPIDHAFFPFRHTQTPPVFPFRHTPTPPIFLET